MRRLLTLLTILSAALGCSGSGSGGSGAGGLAGAGGSGAPDSGVGGGASCATGRADCDSSPGCEVMLETDPQHCGACGTSCRGGACAAGVCQPVTLWEGALTSNLAIDDEHVHFGVSIAGTPSIARVPKQGGAPETFATQGELAAGIVAVDASDVFWVDVSGDAYRAPKAGGAPNPLMQGASYGHLWVDDTHVYFTDAFAGFTEGRLSRMPKAGGSPEMVTEGEPLSAIVTDAEAIYWITCNFEAWKKPKLGGAISRIASLAPTGNCPRAGVGVDAAHLYFVAESEQKIYRIAKDGSGASVVVDAAPAYPTIVAANSKWLLWSSDTYATNGVSVTAKVLPNGEPRPIDTGLSVQHYLRADDEAAYWVDAVSSITRIRVAVLPNG